MGRLVIEDKVVMNWEDWSGWWMVNEREEEISKKVGSQVFICLRRCVAFLQSVNLSAAKIRSESEIGNMYV